MGGLDEYFFAHQEEIDLCWRMQLAGIRLCLPRRWCTMWVAAPCQRGMQERLPQFQEQPFGDAGKEFAEAVAILRQLCRMLLDMCRRLKGLFAGEGTYFMADM